MTFLSLHTQKEHQECISLKKECVYESTSSTLKVMYSCQSDSHQFQGCLYYGYEFILAQVLLSVYNVPTSILGMGLGIKWKKCLHDRGER